MFEDFKEKVRAHEEKVTESPITKALSPQVLERLECGGIDPDNFTLNQLWSEVLDKDGVDLSLMSVAEMDAMVTYGTLRKYLIGKYPQS